jgi:hypothetical protein
MRNTIIPLSLSLVFFLACGDDSEPTRPQDGTVKAWESCVWDGQQVPALCDAESSCSRNGVCSPICEVFTDCPKFEGFDVECNHADEAYICAPKCNAANECPKTGGVELQCRNFYCVGD